MTNLAFEERCKMQSISFTRANVGDRYVSEELDRRKWILGGENSGHILVKIYILLEMASFLHYRSCHI